MDMHPHEEALVRAFFVPSKRARYLTLLGNPKRRRKILDRLNHHAADDLDPRFTTLLPSTTDIDLARAMQRSA